MHRAFLLRLCLRLFFDAHRHDLRRIEQRQALHLIKQDHLAEIQGRLRLGIEVDIVLGIPGAVVILNIELVE